jgi:hypothetical protein
MIEWATIGVLVGIAAAFFTAVWVLVESAKKSAHARIQRCEHTIDMIVQDCGKKKDEYITVRAFDRFEKNIMDRLDGVTKRFDDFLIYARNGGTKK